MSSDSAAASESITRWRRAITHELETLTGSSDPGDWFERIIKDQGKIDWMPPSYVEAIRSGRPPAIRALLALYELSRRTEKRTGTGASSNSNFAKEADEILIKFYSASCSKRIDEDNEVKEEADAWLRRASVSIPSTMITAGDEGDALMKDGSLLNELKGDQVFMAMYAKHSASGLCGVRQEKEMENIRRLITRIRAKGELELDTFWNNRKLLDKTIRHVLRCSMCEQFSANPRCHLPCLHLVCESCYSEAPQCPYCPSATAAARFTDDPIASSSEPPFVVIAFLGLHERCIDPSETFECVECVRMADQYCLECGTLHCSDHARPLYHDEAHTILSAMDFLDGGRLRQLLFSFCPHHKRRFRYFCAHCQSCVCSHPSCANAHLDHLEFPAPKVDDQTCDGFVDDIVRLRATLKLKSVNVMSRMRSIEMNEIRVADQQETIKNDLLTEFNVLEALLADSKAQLLDQLRMEADRVTTELESGRGAMKDWAGEFEKLDFHLRFLEHHPTWSRTVAFRRKALELCMDPIGGHLLDTAEPPTFADRPLVDLLDSIDRLGPEVTAVDHPSPVWTPYLTADSAVVQCRLFQDNLYVCQRSQFDRYQLSMFNTTAGDPLKSIAKIVLTDTSIVAFANLTVDTDSGKVYSATWRQKLLDTIGLSTSKPPYLVIDEYSNYLEKSKTFVLDWLRMKSPTQKVRAEALHRRLYVNDSDSIFELSLDGQILRTMSFNGGTSKMTVDHFLLDSDFARAIAFDFGSKKAVEYDWIRRESTSYDLPVESSLITASKDEFGHFFLVDTQHRTLIITDRNFAVLSTVGLPPARSADSRAPTSIDQLFSKLLANNPGTLRSSNLEIVEDRLYLVDNGKIWTRNLMPTGHPVP